MHFRSTARHGHRSKAPDPIPLAWVWHIACHRRLRDIGALQRGGWQHHALGDQPGRSLRHIFGHGPGAEQDTAGNLRPLRLPGLWRRADSPVPGRTDRRGDRKSVVEGKGVSVRVDLGGRLIIKKKKNYIKQNNLYINTMINKLTIKK